MNKIILVSILLLLFSTSVFATSFNICENIHVNQKMQATYFGQNFGQTVCISGFQSNRYFVDYSNGNWTWVLHNCVKPIEQNNLLRFYYCGGLKNGK